MEKYITDLENVNSVLDQYGFAIIPRLITEYDCEILFTKMWTFFEEITASMPVPALRTKPETWNTLLDLFPSHGMLFQQWGVGHAEFAWWIRQHPLVVDAFAKIWKVDKNDLLVSFDGASFQAPPDRDGNPTPNRGWGSSKPWYHSDQSLKRNNRECIQGWITAKEVEEGDATLAVLAGSHRYHADVAKKFPFLVKSDDWVKFDETVVSFFSEHGCEPVRVACPAGSLVLWDSRTAHMGAPPLHGRSTPKFRAVVYVCYTPRSQALPKNIEKKRKHFVEKRTTSHWPGKPKAFGKYPRTYGTKPLPTVAKPSDPVVTEFGMKLAGF